uniref:Integrin alpha-X-like third Ig-like domain-containing protein n=1 Tax=Chrysemys picta bellii TaxID=8478 RepID=A0A8C3FQA5_CHRPI
FSSPSLEESTKYVNFSAKEAGTSVPVTHRYEVKNLRHRSIPISVTFQFPVELSGVRVWDASEVVPSKVPASPCHCAETPAPAHPLAHPAISFRPQDCSVATCKKIRCRITSLKMQQPLEFMIKGNVSFQWVSQVRELPLPPSTGQGIPPCEQPLSPSPQVAVQTVVERYEVYNYLPIIVGSSVGGLVLLALITTALYKVSGQGLDPFPHSPSPWGRGLWPSQLGGGGERVPHPIPLTHNVSLSIWLSPSPPSVSYQLNFFKRQYKEMTEDARDGVGARLGQNDSANVCLNPDIPKQ